MTNNRQNNYRGNAGGRQPQTPKAPETQSKKGFWRWPEPDASNAVATILLVIVGIWGVVETRHSLELSERAWLGLSGGTVAVPLVLGQPVHFAMQFANPGKEPATDMNFAQDTGTIPTPPNNDFSGVSVRENNTCADLAPVDGGGVVVPGGSLQRGSDTGRGAHPEFVDNGFMQGQSMIFLQGCTVYRTIGGIHHTAYCVIFQNLPQPTPSVPVAGLLAPNNGTGGPVGAGKAASGTPQPVIPLTPVNVTNCPTGNTAD